MCEREVGGHRERVQPSAAELLELLDALPDLPRPYNTPDLMRFCTLQHTQPVTLLQPKPATAPNVNPKNGSCVSGPV